MSTDFVCINLNKSVLTASVAPMRAEPVAPSHLTICSDNPQMSPTHFLMGPARYHGDQTCIYVRVGVFDGAMAAMAPADPGSSGPLCSFFFFYSPRCS